MNKKNWTPELADTVCDSQNWLDDLYTVIEPPC